jgi:hypothetical protein
MLAAIRRASSRVISLVAARRPGSSSKIDIGERLTGLILHDETGFAFLDGPRRREAALGHLLQSSSASRVTAGAATGSRRTVVSRKRGCGR